MSPMGTEIAGLFHGYPRGHRYRPHRLVAPEIVEKKLWQDPKSRFQEMAQEEEIVTPTYMTIREQGPDHDKTFHATVVLQGEDVATGSGSSKKAAEMSAALDALAGRKVLVELQKLLQHQAWLTSILRT